jgi:hypothetical protein
VQSLEREINESRNFLSKELNARTDETLNLMRQVDQLSADFKRVTSQNSYIESQRADLEANFKAI